MVKRTCGSCRVCCVYPEIPALKKPAGQACEFLCEAGCSAYSQRPRMCKDYQCAWIEGQGKDADRPDRSGVLIDRRPTQFGMVLVARSAVAGSRAIKTKQGRLAIRRMHKSSGMGVLVTADEDNQRVVSSLGVNLRRPLPVVEVSV